MSAVASDASAPLIRVENLRKVYGEGDTKHVALEDASFVVRRGEIFGVIGPSGAGKSTLIRCLNLLERPSGGRVIVGDTDLTALSAPDLRAHRRKIGTIFQQFHLLRSRTAAENVALPLEIQGVLAARERRARVADLLHLVGLSARAKAYPSQLSGGEKQRVGIARALAAEPEVLLSDEATSALDGEATRSVLDLLRDVNARLGVTIVLITHELDVVKALCHSAALLARGRVVEAGRLDALIRDPSSRLGAALLPAAVGSAPAPAAGQTFDLVFADAETATPALTALAGSLGVRVTILAGGVEPVAGLRPGRLRVQVQADSGDVDGPAVTRFLEAGGARVSRV